MTDDEDKIKEIRKAFMDNQTELRDVMELFRQRHEEWRNALLSSFTKPMLDNLEKQQEAMIKSIVPINEIFKQMKLSIPPIPEMTIRQLDVYSIKTKEDALIEIVKEMSEDVDWLKQAITDLYLLQVVHMRETRQK